MDPDSEECTCGCLGGFCPCGAPCTTCFPPAQLFVPYEDGAQFPVVAEGVPEGIREAAALHEQQQPQQQQLSVEDMMAYGAAAAAPPPEPEPEPLEWEEALFRRQFSGEPVAHQLRHLHPFVPRLLPLYAAFFFLRTRGFVLHSGVKLGMDYMAYPPGGPPRWHAQFAVLVGDLEHVCDLEADPAQRLERTPANARLDNVQRCMQVSLTQKKSLLFVRVLSSLPRGKQPFGDAPLSAASDAAVSSSAGSTAAPATLLSSSDPVAVFRSLRVSATLLKQWFVSKGRGAASSGAPADRAKKAQDKQSKQQERQQQRKEQQTQQQQSKKQKTQHAAASLPSTATNA